MADNNKISIDVTVNSDAEKQIDNYVKSFDSLRNSINGLSQPFNSFSNSLNSLDKSLSKYAESLNQINTQNKDLIANSDSTTNKVSGISSSFLAWNEVIKILRTTTLSWTMALTGGLTIITTFLPEIINFVKTMFSGKVAVNEMITNFKSLNEVMKASNKDVAAEVTRLQILYKSATDVTNAQEDRIRSVKELKRQYPDYLKGIKDEDILNGSSKTV
jgi:uncharacterized protein YoxC